MGTPKHRSTYEITLPPDGHVVDLLTRRSLLVTAHRRIVDTTAGYGVDQSAESDVDHDRRTGRRRRRWTALTVRVSKAINVDGTGRERRRCCCRLRVGTRRCRQCWNRGFDFRCTGSGSIGLDIAAIKPTDDSLFNAGTISGSSAEVFVWKPAAISSSTAALFRVGTTQ